MSTLSPAMPWTIILVDVEGFSGRLNPVQAEVRAGLYEAVEVAFTRSGMSWEECKHEDRGDGIFILVPISVPKSTLVTRVPHELTAALREHNETHVAEARIRLRMAIHAGEIQYDEHGVVGAAVNYAFRLLDAKPLKRALRNSAGKRENVLAVIASDWFFREVIRHNPDSGPDMYRQARVKVKETRDIGWICVPPRDSVRSRYLIPAVILAVVLVAGLSYAVPTLTGDDHPATGSPSPQNSQSARKPGLGNPRAADPCSLMNPVLFDRFGETDLATDYANFGRCDVLIQDDDGDIADIQVQFAHDPAPEPGPRDHTEQRGAVRIVRAPANSDECDQTLVLADGNLVRVTAERLGSGRVDLCAAATIAANAAADRLTGGPIGQRSISPASLATLDACRLLDAAALAGVPGVDVAHPDGGFARWNCRWHSGTTGTSIQLRFDRNQPLTAEDGQPTELSGYRAFITPKGDGDDTCLARVVFRTYTNTKQEKISELVLLVVSGPAPTGRLCDQASGLAAAAAAKLPPA